MANLPTPGQDAGNWGKMLNDFLLTSHDNQGGLKAGVVQGAHIAANAVDDNILGTSGGSDGQVLTKDSSASSGFAWKTAPSGGGGATSVTMGGDLSGSSSSATIANNAVNTAKIADSAVTEAKLSVSNSPAANQVLSWNGNAMTWMTPATGGTGGTATTVTMGGDVTGSSDNAVIANGAVTEAKLAQSVVDKLNGAGSGNPLGNVTVTGTPSAGQVLKATSATAATWQADATGSGGGSAPTMNFVTVNTAETVNAANGDVLLCDPTTTGINITLPAATAGAVVRVKRVVGAAVSNGIQVAAPSGSFIDAASGVGTDVINSEFDCRSYICDGTNWYRFF